MSHSLAYHPEVPSLHPQWGSVDFAALLREPFAYIAIGYSNSILAEFGAQSGEQLWQRARTPGGMIDATLAVEEAVRNAGRPVVWTRYELFRDMQPQTAIDRAQYTYWTTDKQHWLPEERERDWQPVAEIKARIRSDDVTIHYTSLGNVFLGTMLPSYLNAWGVRTVLLSGFHLDWCIEQAARSARDLGYNPIVIGDASGCGRLEDDYPTLQRINTFFAPVMAHQDVITALSQREA